MSEDTQTKFSMKEIMKELDKEITSMVKEKIANLSSQDLEVHNLQGQQDLAINKVLTHEPCDSGDCAICDMKKKVFESGLTGGIKVGQKYPKEKF